MNGWRRVEKANITPMQCAVFPQLGASHRDGYVDTGTELPGWDPHCFVSVVAARQLGEFVGLVDPGELERKVIEVSQLEAELETLRGRVAELETQLAAVDTLVSADFRARAKPGRPKKEMAV